MASLKDIRMRISSTKNTQQITRAMKMVSAAKLKKAQDNIQNMRPYAKGILSVIGDIAYTHRVTHPLLGEVLDPKKVLVVAITSDRGLCGGFNNSINRYIENWHKENKDKYEQVDYMFIGKKVADYFKNTDMNIVDKMLNLAREISYVMAANIAEKLMTQFTKGDYDKVVFVYNEFKSAIAQELSAEQIFPVDIQTSNLEQEGEDSPFSKDLIFEPLPEEMIEELLHKHFAVQVYRCLSESVAAEHAARMTSMENATNNAKEMIDSLTLVYNKLRQASITTELIEISSGAEALKG